MSIKISKFPMGQIVATTGVNELLRNDSSLLPLLNALVNRHNAGDWGTVCAEDKAENDFAVKNGLRILSSYILGDAKIWIITESDRSVTTILFPNES